MVLTKDTETKFERSISIVSRASSKVWKTALLRRLNAFRTQTTRTFSHAGGGVSPLLGLSVLYQGASGRCCSFVCFGISQTGQQLCVGPQYESIFK